jgi:nucleoside-diphosphate-sugar epimerase
MFTRGTVEARMAAFAVTGATTPLGALVLAGLAADGTVVCLPPVGESHEPAAEDALSLEGAGCLVSLSVGPCPDPEGGGSAKRLAALRRALAAADASGVTRVVHLSSAVVYGAATDNPVPITEDAPVRPDPALAWALELAEAERLLAEWRDGGSSRTAAILRPALVVAPGDGVSLARALGGLSGPRVAGERRPVQFVHIDDVAAAVVLCATTTQQVDGAFNVAPDGWVGDDEAAALAGALVAPPSLPPRLAGPARRVLWASRIGTTPPEAESYATHPWVVAADRLRALGWRPTHSAEEAVVATTSCSTLASLPPGRRQQLLLAVTGGLLAGLLVATAAVLLRSLRRVQS